MSFSISIVGLPNVGKSTLFNALTNLQAQVANYPFTTIEPNVGIVPVPDERLEKLAKLENAQQIIPTTIEFKDIAGLVKEAHKGAGLGNQFLSHIREVDAIVEVVRLFEDPNVAHVEGSVNPQRDLETLETELILADLQLIEKKRESLKSAAKSGHHEDILKAAVAQKYFEALAAGKLASTVNLTAEEQSYFPEFPLLTNKPILYVANAKFNLDTKHFDLSPRPTGLRPLEGGRATLPAPGERVSPFSLPPLARGGIEGEVVVLDAQLEAELSLLSVEERKEYLTELSLPESGLTKLIKAAYQTLNLVTFFTTVKPGEIRAWTCKVGTKAPQAAGIIHTDFEKGFIKAEVINWQTLLDAGGYVPARERGLLRQEGKDYVVQDGDVVHFRFNV